MKKTSPHFKSAAWTIKNPKASYGIMGALALVMVLVGVVLALSARGTSKGPSRVLAAVTGNPTPEQAFVREGWVIRGQQDKDGMRCIRYARESNGTRLTACYTQVNGAWVHKSSY